MRRDLLLSTKAALALEMNQFVVIGLLRVQNSVTVVIKFHVKKKAIVVMLQELLMNAN